jgi:hypothetical protein
MYRQELALCETVLGKEHPDTLTSMNNLALVLSDQGKYEQAEEIQRQTLRYPDLCQTRETSTIGARLGVVETIIRNSENNNDKLRARRFKSRSPSAPLAITAGPI